MLMMMSFKTWNELYPELRWKRLWITLCVGVYSSSQHRAVNGSKGETLTVLTRKEEVLGPS